ncbi:MAG: TetR/AcrR family transcriptional regulator, partial [Candidatus Marinimicrobia bacterium]|nr:TetR/AcrR family transcriptional regulator [Candidatus Neomarinimicrobiota bacterium]
ITQGYHGTSMRDIATGAGIAVGGIYNHFDSKETIFIEVMKRWHPFVQVQPLLNEAQGDTVRSILCDTIERLAAIHYANPTLYNLFFIEAVEFNGKHLPLLRDELKPLIVKWMQRIQAAEGELETTGGFIAVSAFAVVDKVDNRQDSNRSHATTP